jgi:hypothetical protein
VGPSKILKKLGFNAYLVDLPTDLHTQPVFNIDCQTVYDGHISEEVHTAPPIKLPTNI